MKIEDVKPGKKYFLVRATSLFDNRTAKKKRETIVYLVVEVDKPGQKVCASIGGTPAQWFDKKKVARWKDSKPEENK